MSAVRSWLLGIIATALLLRVTETLFPKGKFQTVSAFVGGLVLLLVTVRPLLGMEIPSLDDYRWEMELVTEEYAAERIEALGGVISEETAAYIQDKASSLGLTCRAEVTCMEREGIPFPHEVWLDIAYHEGLSHCIATDLAIDRGRQHWRKEVP